GHPPKLGLAAHWPLETEDRGVVQVGIRLAPDRDGVNRVAEPDASLAINREVVRVVVEHPIETGFHGRRRSITVEADDPPRAALAPIQVALGVEGHRTNPGRVPADVGNLAGPRHIAHDAAGLDE